MKISSFLKRNLDTLLGFGVLALCCSQRHTGFMMGFVVVPALLYQLYKLAWSWKIPVHKNRYLGAIAINLVATGIVIGVHIVHHVVARKTAEGVAQEIIRFNKAHGRFPVDFAEAGISKFSQKSLSNPAYFNNSGSPVLFYAATFIVYDTWAFDFPSQTWEYKPD